MSAEVPSTHTTDQPALHLIGRRVMGVIAVIALHLAIFWLSGWAAVMTPLPEVLAPRESLLVLSVALLQAWCSLGAIWLSRSRWPSHVNTLIASLISAGIWIGVILILGNTDFHSPNAAGWLVSLATQCLTTTLAMLVVDRILHRSLLAPGGRFTIMFLLVWTGVVALLLGAGRLLAENFGWTWAGIFSWQYFSQLQVVGLFNALLAVSLWTALHRRPTWRSRMLAAAAIVITTIVTANLLMFSVFKDVGVEPVDLCWLYGGQSLFLLATLVPLQIASQGTFTAEPQTPPPPDSGH
jgi:hypothetical protein